MNHQTRHAFVILIIIKLVIKKIVKFVIILGKNLIFFDIIKSLDCNAFGADQCESCDGATLRTISGNSCLCPAGYYDQTNEPIC